MVLPSPMTSALGCSTRGSCSSSGCSAAASAAGGATAGGGGSSAMVRVATNEESLKELLLFRFMSFVELSFETVIDFDRKIQFVDSSSSPARMY